VQALPVSLRQSLVNIDQGLADFYDVENPADVVWETLAYNDAFPASATRGTSPLMKDAILTAPGRGYKQSTTGVTVGAPTGPVPYRRCAEAYALVSERDGAVLAVWFRDMGRGYTKEPTLTITGQGEGAQATAELRWTGTTNMLRPIFKALFYISRKSLKLLVREALSC
jgi:hypothetical protein